MIWEYRVCWKREGQPKKRKIYQTLAGAEHFCDNVLREGEEELDDEDGIWNLSTSERERMLAPFEEGPTIEVRSVGDWEKLAR